MSALSARGLFERELEFIRFMVFVLGLVVFAAVILRRRSAERLSIAVSVDGNGLSVDGGSTATDKEALCRRPRSR